MEVVQEMIRHFWNPGFSRAGDRPRLKPGFQEHRRLPDYFLNHHHRTRRDCLCTRGRNELRPYKYFAIERLPDPR
jgi:hypothetical protein